MWFDLCFKIITVATGKNLQQVRQEVSKEKRPIKRK